MGPGKSARNVGTKLNAWVGEADIGAFSFALSMTFGAVVYLQLAFEPSAIRVFSGAGGALILWLVARRFARTPLISICAMCVFAAALGLAAAKVRADTRSATTVVETLGPVLVEGWVTAVEPGAKGPRLRLRIHAIDGLDQSETPNTIRLTHTTRLAVAPGRFVRCWSVLRPPPGPSAPGDYDFQRQAWFDGLGAVGYVQGRCRGGALGAPNDLRGTLQLKLSTARRALATVVADAAGSRAGGFAAALVSGDRSFMDEADREALRRSGLAHLLAISGLHMAIVGGLIYALVRRGLALIEPIALRVPVQKAAAIGALIASAVYLILSGASIATQRAFIMAAVFFTAILIDRPAFSPRNFAIAMVAVVALRPESVMSAGFQMSFAATGVLIAVYDAWRRRRRLEPRGWLSAPAFAIKSLIVTSVAASAATMPFALYHFERTAPLGVLANLAAMPIVSILAAPAAAAALILAPFGIWEIGIRAFGLALEGVLAVAHFFATDAGGLSKPMPPSAFVWSIAAIVVLVSLRGVWRVWLTTVVLAASAWSWAVAPPIHVYWPPSGDVFAAGPDGAYQRVRFVDGEGLSPMRFAEAEISRDCSDRNCEIDGPGFTLGLFNAPPIECPKDALILVASRRPTTSCPNVVAWSDAVRSGGMAITLRDGRPPLIKSHAACGVRPWRPCPRDQS